MTLKSIKIREIFDDYIPQVDPREWRPDAFKIAFEALNVQNVRRLVAQQGHEDVGFAAFRVSEKDGCELVSLASKYSGKDIGRALVEYLTDQYDVWVVSDRYAEKFYEHMGFSQITPKREDVNRRKVYQWSQ